MQCEKLFAAIDALKGEYIKFWEDVCNIESPTDYKAGVDACCDYFIKKAESFGWKTEVFPQTAAGSPVCITMNPEAKGRPISLSGHLDTVHPVGSFGTPAVILDSERIYGPGACDCKGGVVGAFYAMAALHSIGFKDRPIMLLLQTDEEVGSKYSQKANIRWICEKSKDSVAFLNLEGNTKGGACVERKGIINFKFIVSGIEAHSSRCATVGANAIIEAAHKMIELEKIKDEDGLTCSCNHITGGTTLNTVAGHCEFVCNVRFATAEQLVWIRKKAKEIADTVYVEGCKTEVVENGFRHAMERNERNLKLLEDMNKIWVDCGMSALKATKRTGGSDAADATVFGLATIDSIGAAGGDIHTRNEYAELNSLSECAKRIATVCVGL